MIFHDCKNGEENKTFEVYSHGNSSKTTRPYVRSTETTKHVKESLEKNVSKTLQYANLAEIKNHKIILIILKRIASKKKIF